MSALSPRLLPSVVHRLSASAPWQALVRHVTAARQLTIARKLQVSLVVCGLGLLVVAVVYAWTRHNSAVAADTFAAHQQDTALAAALGTQVAEARRLQTRYAVTFADEDRTALQTARQRLEGTLQQLREGAAEAGSSAALTEVGTAIGAFAEGISALNARVDEMGRGEAGLRGQLDAAAAVVDAALQDASRPTLDASWQAMRRQEALLLLTGDASHSDRASEAKLPFELALSASGLPGTAQDAARAAMEAYQGALLAYTAARVGLDVEALSLADTAEQIGPALAALETAQAAGLETARAQQRRQAQAMTVVFALTLGLVATMLIATLLLVLGSVRRPITDTLRFAEDIAEDRLDTTLAVRNPHDEIGQLAQRLVHMQERRPQRR